MCTLRYVYIDRSIKEGSLLLMVGVIHALIAYRTGSLKMTCMGRYVVTALGYK